MPALNKVDKFSEDLASGVHNFSADQLKLMLTNTAPTAANSVIADITEITAGNGYVANDITLTASGGSIGPYRYAVLYNSTAANGPIIGWYDKGAAVTLNDTDSDTFDFDGTNGALTFT